jgi:hypothetical protein
VGRLVRLEPIMGRTSQEGKHRMYGRDGTL